nr:hypothetical protein CFP56_54032 [Quercus suber]
MSQPYKLAKLRWDYGQSEVVVGKDEFLKVTYAEEAVVRLERPIKPAVAQVLVNHLTTFCITCDPIPGTIISEEFDGKLSGKWYEQIKN